MPGIGLVIFDCDGVLVDSEPLAMRVLLDGLGEAGYAIGEEEAYERFLGRSLANMQSVLRGHFGSELPPDRLDIMRRRLLQTFRAELKPMDGVDAMLDRLTIARCVASSSQMERLRVSLEATDLLSRFEPYLFSATMVAHGKPEPDLFLYVAERMAAAPADCLVIEDSSAGIEAAQRAGMRVFGFVGGSHARSASYRAKLAALAPELIFDDMSRLPALIGEGQPPRHTAAIR